jgi:hypothetical protein
MYANFSFRGHYYLSFRHKYFFLSEVIENKVKGDMVYVEQWRKLLNRGAPSAENTLTVKITLHFSKKRVYPATITFQPNCSTFFSLHKNLVDYVTVLISPAPEVAIKLPLKTIPSV